MKKIVIIATTSISFQALIKGLPKFLSNFYSVEIITSPSNKKSVIEKYESVKVTEIEMTRKITIVKDIVSLYRVYKYLLKNKPDIVYTFTPKAGLLGMMASFLASTPVRIHNIVGMPLMESSGLRRKILVAVEKATYAFSNKLLCNSSGLVEYIHRNITNKKIQVVANGSINGVDTNVFDRSKFTLEYEKDVKALHGVKDEDFVLLFVGRLVKDKGINELVEAFLSLEKQYKNIRLLLVGDFEEELNPLDKDIKSLILSHSGIIHVGFQDDIRDFLLISDLFVLPSYREGMPNALLEAGSFNLPIITTNINGCNEIVVNGENGLLIRKKNVDDLLEALTVLVSDKKIYSNIQNNARGYIKSRFSQDFFWDEFLLMLRAL
mgnify:FL=1